MLILFIAIRLQVTLKVDCENTNVSTEWELKHRHSNDDINGYCLDYKCITIPQQQKVSQLISLNYCINSVTIKVC